MNIDKKFPLFFKMTNLTIFVNDHFIGSIAELGLKSWQFCNLCDDRIPRGWIDDNEHRSSPGCRATKI